MKTFTILIMDNNLIYINSCIKKLVYIFFLYLDFILQKKNINNNKLSL